MSLEIIHRTPESAHATPIVLLHGAWHGAWTWDNGFVDRLADGGFEVLVLSLRGHGDSSGSARVTSLGKYLADLSSVLDKLDRSPVIVGHSMGGLSPNASSRSGRWWGRYSWRPSVHAVRGLRNLADGSTLRLTV